MGGLAQAVMAEVVEGVAPIDHEGVAEAASAVTRRALLVALVAYLLIHVAFAALVQQALFADGAAVLLRVAATQGFSVLDWPRAVADFFIEWPVVLATRLGVHDLRTLSYLLGVGYQYLPPTMLAVSSYLLPEARKSLILFPILSLLFGWMGTCFAPIIQGNMFAAWFWPTLFVLIFHSLRGPRDIAVIAFFVLPMAALYETVLLVAPLLAAVAVTRWRGHGRRPHRWVWIVVAGWCLASALLALYFALHPRNPGNRANFLWGLETGAFLIGQGGSVNWPLALALVGAPILWLSAWRPALARATMTWWLPPLVLFAGFVALAPVLSPSTFAPIVQVMARAVASLSPAILAPMALRAHAIGWRPDAMARRLLTVVLALIAAAQITWHMAATAQWAGFLTMYRAALSERPGLIVFETTPMARPAIGIQVLRPLTWAWTNPWMSVALAPGGRVAAIIANAGGRASGDLDPSRPGGLLPIAGVDYAEFVAAEARGSGAAAPPAP
jgi:hypothetical protein